MPRKEPDDSRVGRVRLPDALLQRLDRYLDWSAPLDAFNPRATPPYERP